MRHLRILRLLALLLLAPFVAAQAIDTAAVDRLAQHTLDAWHIPGVAVAIVIDDKVVYAHGYGVKEMGKSDPVTADTLFGVASTTKAFTTAAMAILVDEKKMSWDDPVRQYIDYFHLSDPCADSLVTLRDIVSHRSGFGRHDELWDDTTLTREQIIRGVASLKVLKPIRTTYQYSNIMFMTAGEATASAAKMPWGAFVKTRLFDPLGMTSTRTSSQEFLATNHATGHRWDAKAQKIVVQPFVDDENLGSAGNIKSSARDMAQWIRFQLADGVIDGKRIVSADALRETRTPQLALGVDKEISPETNIQSYAMGWNVQDYRGELLVAHAGALNGYRTQVALLPNQHAGVVVILNAGRGYAGLSLRNSFMDMMLGRTPKDWDAFYLAADKKSDEKDTARKLEREAKRRKDTHPSRELAAYAGTYTHPAYGAMTVALENNTLVLRWQHIAATLTHFQFDTFTATDDANALDEQVTFRLGEDGNVNMLTIWGEEFAKK
jgi:CubicO group peptidase (beta-lactamase class C family)